MPAPYRNDILAALITVLFLHTLACSSVKKPRLRKPIIARQPLLGPIIVPHIMRSDIKFAQLDPNGFPTSVTHYFREFPYTFKAPAKGGEPQRGFKVLHPTADGGTIERYRLRNLATGEPYEFPKVPASKGGDGTWHIPDSGWKQIRHSLQKKMRIPLSPAMR